jgi:hypothetical protein
MSSDIEGETVLGPPPHLSQKKSPFFHIVYLEIKEICDYNMIGPSVSIDRIYVLIIDR